MDFNEAYDDTNTSVGLAARLGDVKLLKQLLVSGRATTGHDNRGWQPLHEAASAGHHECVKLLTMADDAEVDALTFEGVTPLYLGVLGHVVRGEEGDSEVVKILLQAGADSNMTKGDNWSLPIAKAVGNVAVLRQLVDAGADPNFDEYENGTALHAAISMGVVDSVQLLLERGADINKRTDLSHAPIHTYMLTRLQADQRILELLLQYKADINARNDVDTTPLMLAVQRGWKSVVWQLLERGADVNIATSTKVLALHFAVEFPKCQDPNCHGDEFLAEDIAEEDTEILEKLLEMTDRSKYIPEAPDPRQLESLGYKYSLYHLSVQWNRFKSLKLLVGAGIPADHFLQESNGPIADRADVNLFRQAPMLVDIGTTVDTPLAFLLSKPLTPLVVNLAKFMIDNGSSVNAVLPKSVPPLVAAVRHQRASYDHNSISHNILHHLVQHGADIMYKIRETDVLPAALHVASLFNPAALFTLLASGVPVHSVYTHDTLQAISRQYKTTWPRFYEVYAMFPWRVISWLHTVDLFVPQLPCDTRHWFDVENNVDDPNMKTAWQNLDAQISVPKTLQQLSVLCVRRRVGETQGWTHLTTALTTLTKKLQLPYTIADIIHFRQIRTQSLLRAPPPSAMALYPPVNLHDSDDSSDSLIASSIGSPFAVQELDEEEEEEEQEGEEESDEQDEKVEEQEEEEEEEEEQNKEAEEEEGEEEEQNIEEEEEEEQNIEEEEEVVEQEIIIEGVEEWGIDDEREKESNSDDDDNMEVINGDEDLESRQRKQFKKSENS